MLEFRVASVKWMNEVVRRVGSLSALAVIFIVWCWCVRSVVQRPHERSVRHRLANWWTNGSISVIARFILVVPTSLIFVSTRSFQVPRHFRS